VTEASVASFLQPRHRLSLSPATARLSKEHREKIVNEATCCV